LPVKCREVADGLEIEITQRKSHDDEEVLEEHWDAFVLISRVS